MLRSDPIVRVLALLLASASCAGAANAADDAPAKVPADRYAATPGARFRQMDTNHDGFVSRDEYLAAERARFEQYDTNRDRKLDANEIARSPPLMQRNLRAAERMMRQWDANHDGVVTLDEYDASSARHFSSMDSGKRGKLAPRLAKPPTKKTSPRP